MNHASLAARYRPQTFADVTGQDTIKAILSRAAAEDRVAPAYLLSGTRGVGKTTIARVFAKALNCVTAPTGEPCNQCETCLRITKGAHVDVVEIDGASNRGIDDARRLRDAIGYAPLEGRYKVFIIDEAHMLTRDAFNALLKTLEEPPARATFILATTEPHKFPVTIVSRCQHFIFKAIPEAGLVAHLTRVLENEAVPFSPHAVRLLARRAAGSVRDSMSLLGQTLALGGAELSEAAVRDVLGLAGQELFERLLVALHAGDCLAVSTLTRELLERGVDLGFFLRELAQLWRNLFLLRQSGEAAIPVLDLPEGESRRLLELSASFELSVIHAAWQVVLEGQRQVLTSLEPAAALELLLLNLALLPRLAGLELFRPLGGSVPPPARPAPTVASPMTAAPTLSAAMSTAVQAAVPPSVPQRPEHRESGQAGSKTAEPESADPDPRSVPESAATGTTGATGTAGATGTTGTAGEIGTAHTEELLAHDLDEAVAPSESYAGWPCDWADFLTHCIAHLSTDGPVNPAHLKRAQGTCLSDEVRIETASHFEYERLNTVPALECLRRMAAMLAGAPVRVTLAQPPAMRSETERRAAAAQHPAVRGLIENFGAMVERCVPLE